MWWWLSRSRERDEETKADESNSVEAAGHEIAESHLIDLQQSVGNQSVQRLISDSSTGVSKTLTPSSSGAGGEPLPRETREMMEAGFGADFGDVRVHTDQTTAESAAALTASAYTSGRDIYFAPGKYAPEKTEGSHLISHELAHVVQQSGGSQGEPGRATSGDSESEAVQASDQMDAGERVKVALTPVAAGATIARSPADWRKDVHDAKMAKDAAGLAKLVETALAANKIKVVVAKTNPGGNVDPKDYRPLPDINFDINLTTKSSKPLSSGATAIAATHSLGVNYGYSFSDAGQKYVVLGPNALSEDTPIITEMCYWHEIYHTTHHIGTGSAQPATAAHGPTPTVPTYKDEEVEAYSHDFLNYFHQLHSFRLQWAPLINFYEGASPAAQRSALALLTNYYNNPPSPPIPNADVPAIKKAFEDWLRRRMRDTATSSKKLIQDLSTALGVSLSGPSPTSTPTPAPTSGPVVPGPPHN
jgi:Domain of unknown function (DUF4157)